MKWTERQDGVERTTVALSLHIPHPLVSWIAGYAAISEAAAVDFVVSRVNDLVDGWHTITIEDREVRVIHVDDINNVVEEGYDIEVYEGPMPTLGRTSRRKKS